MDRLFLAIGSFSAFLAVAAGAFGAHKLKQILSPEMLAIFETGARYQMYHSLALVAVALLGAHFPGKLVRVAGWLFAAGILIFSGTLYLLAATEVKWLGAITPVGGVCLLSGWLCLGTAALRGRR